MIANHDYSDNKMYYVIFLYSKLAVMSRLFRDSSSIPLYNVVTACLCFDAVSCGKCGIRTYFHNDAVENRVISLPWRVPYHNLLVYAVTSNDTFAMSFSRVECRVHICIGQIC